MILVNGTDLLEGDPMLPVDQVVTLEYRDYRGRPVRRDVVPSRIWFGETAIHPGTQWLLDAYDIDKGAYRTFAVRDVLAFICDNEGRVPGRPRAQVPA